MIEKCKSIIYLENNDPAKSSSLIKYLQTRGYTIYWHFSPFYNTDNFFQIESNVSENIIEENMYCVQSELKPSVQGLLELISSNNYVGYRNPTYE